MVRVESTLTPIETKTGFMLANVPNGSLGWVELASLREWVVVTLVRQAPDEASTQAEFMGPPGAARQWMYHWEKTFQATHEKPKAIGFYITTAHANLDGAPHPGVECCIWCCSDPLEHFGARR